VGSSVILPAPGQPGKGPDPNFKTATQPNLVSFGIDDIAPPSPLYIQRDDKLVLQTMTNRNAGDTVFFNVRLLMAAPDLPGQPDQAPPATPPPGPKLTQTIRTNINTIAVPNAHVLQSLTVNLAEGYLISASATPLNANSRGATYAAMAIARQGAQGLQPFESLFGDYCTQSVPCSWPGGRTISPAESSGLYLSQAITAPGAGADFSFTVPNFTRIQIISFAGVFTASAAVANRNVELIIDDGVNIVWAADVGAAIAAGQVENITATQTNVPNGVIATIQSAVVPPGNVLTGGFRFRSLTGNIQAGDQWSALFMLIQEWVDI